MLYLSQARSTIPGVRLLSQGATQHSVGFRSQGTNPRKFLPLDIRKTEKLDYKPLERAVSKSESSNLPPQFPVLGHQELLRKMPDFTEEAW